MVRKEFEPPRPPGTVRKPFRDLLEKASLLAVSRVWFNQGTRTMQKKILAGMCVLFCLWAGGSTQPTKGSSDESNCLRCLFTAPHVREGLSAISHEAANLRGLFGLDVLVELGEAARRLGLTSERLHATTEDAVRSAGIRPPSAAADPCNLYVKVIVEGPAFNVSLRMQRTVGFRAGREVFRTVGTVWQDEFLGAHGDDPESIVSVLQELLGQFCSDFLKANRRRSVEFTQ